MEGQPPNTTPITSDSVNRIEAIIEHAEIRSTLDQKDKMERLVKNKDKLLEYLRSNIIGT